MKRFAIALAVGLFATIAAPVRAADGATDLWITVPEGAQLFLNNSPTTVTGTVRHFVIDNRTLVPGQLYQYPMQAVAEIEGTRYEKALVVQFRPGDVIQARFFFRETVIDGYRGWELAADSSVQPAQPPPPQPETQPVTEPEPPPPPTTGPVDPGYNAGYYGYSTPDYGGYSYPYYSGYSGGYYRYGRGYYNRYGGYYGRYNHYHRPHVTPYRGGYYGGYRSGAHVNHYRGGYHYGGYRGGSYGGYRGGSFRGGYHGGGFRGGYHGGGVRGGFRGGRR